MHGPVRPPRHGELPGAVERVDDPHPVGPQPLEVVVRLFGQHRVIGPLVTQAAQNQRVGADISGVTERGRKIVTDLLADPQQQPSGLLGNCLEHLVRCGSRRDQGGHPPKCGLLRGESAGSIFLGLKLVGLVFGLLVATGTIARCMICCSTRTTTSP